MRTLKKMPNVFFQSYETKPLYHELFMLNQDDHDGYVLSAALFMKLSYPFRKVILLSKDKKLNIRWEESLTRM